MQKKTILGANMFQDINSEDEFSLGGELSHRGSKNS